MKMLATLLFTLLTWTQVTVSTSSLRGHSENAVETRIVDGVTVDEEDRYPYFTLLFGTHMCGGVLIAPDLVLTAAHCINAATHVRVGAYNLPRGKIPNPNVDYIEIEQQRQHPFWGLQGFSYDIMIIKLASKSTKQYAQINSNPYLPVHPTNLTLVGFGDTTPGSTDIRFPNRLQEVELDFIEHPRCQSRHPRGSITDDMLCAMEANKGACRGDSGGPLFIKGATPADDVIVGTVSWGRGCANDYYPSVFSSISFSYAWILMEACWMSPNDLPPSFDCTGLTGERQNGSGEPSATPSDEPTVAPSSAPSTRPTLEHSSTPTIEPSTTPSSSPADESNLGTSTTSNNFVEFVSWIFASEPLQHCQGDCDDDDQCAGDMVCYRRGTRFIPGCSGMNGLRLADYCVYPSDIPGN